MLKNLSKRKKYNKLHKKLGPTFAAEKCINKI